jgi:hypothetical protein
VIVKHQALPFGGQFCLGNRAALSVCDFSHLRPFQVTNPVTNPETGGSRVGIAALALAISGLAIGLPSKACHRICHHLSPDLSLFERVARDAACRQLSIGQRVLSL